MNNLLPALIAELLALGSKKMDKKLADLTVAEVLEILININKRYK